MKVKQAACKTEVPAILSPTNKDIEVGTVVEYKKIKFWNGEHHLILINGDSVPSIFFNT